jgi:hypothetical protein
MKYSLVWFLAVFLILRLSKSFIHIAIQRRCSYKGLKIQSESFRSYISNKNVSVQNLRRKISDAGQAGILSYGFLNLIYYTAATAFAWKFSYDSTSSSLISLPFEKKLTIIIGKLSKVLLVVWTGSQVTKVFRLIGAITLSPFMEKWIARTQERFAFKSRNKLFWIIVCGIVLVTIAFYTCLVLSTTLMQ